MEVGGVPEGRTHSSSLRVEVADQKRQRTRSGTRGAPAAETASTETALTPLVRNSRRKPRVLKILEKIDMKLVEGHFNSFGKDIHDNDGSGGCEPYHVANNVSQEDLREYCEHTSYESSTITLRFLELTDSGELLIVELPSRPHELLVREFEGELRDQDVRFFISFLGSLTLIVGDTCKQADNTYGPRRKTPNSVCPQNIPNGNWITFIVEVAKSQTWPAMRKKTILWYGYPGIQYILLMQIKLVGQALNLMYELYDVEVNNLLGPGTLPTEADGIVAGNFRSDEVNGAAQHITLENRRILGIPQNQPLPHGVSDNVTIDLCTVLNQVLLSL
jgi:hypothetical protein